MSGVDTEEGSFVAEASMFLESGCSLLQQSQDVMSGEIQRRLVIVRDPMGLHMRPLSVFSQKAGQFQSAVTVTKGSECVNGKSFLELLLLAAEQGTELLLEVTGPDAAAAVDVLAEILAAPGLEEIMEPPPKG